MIKNVMKKLQIFLMIVCSTVTNNLTAQTWDEIIKLTASDADAGDEFGFSVALDGNQAIIGAYGNEGAFGSVYIFEKLGGVWTEVIQLTASDADSPVFFGFSVTISGDQAIVGAYGDDEATYNAGAAYIFEKLEGTWTEVEKLMASDSEEVDFFGYSVSISGDQAVVGAFGNDDTGDSSGSAYVFEKSGESWTETIKLSASDAAGADLFGVAVSISEDQLIVGAYGNDDGGDNSGSAYIFEKSGGTWAEITKLTAADHAGGDSFGIAVSISGDQVIVGAYMNDDDGGPDCGSAYIFEKSGGMWTEVIKLNSSDSGASDYFGRSVSISGDKAIVGASQNDDVGAESGSAYIFEKSGGTWTEAIKLTSSDEDSGDFFGRSVSISGSQAIMGAPNNDDDGTSSGSAYIFDKCEELIVTATATETEVCEGETITLTGEGTDIYDWDLDVYDGVAFTPPVGETTYTVQGTDTEGCSGVDSVDIIVTEEITIISVTTDEIAGDDGAIDITISGGEPTYTFDWDNDGTGDFDDLEDLIGLSAGTYTVVVEGEGGCSSSEEINVNSQLSVDELAFSSVNLYPNPTLDAITINVDGMFTYALFDMAGELVLTGVAVDQEKLSLEEIPTGVYHVKIQSIENVETVRLVKN